MCRKHSQRGFTLVELMLASAILTLISGVTLAVSHAVRMSWEHNQGYLLATQHANVTLERIARAVRSAHATADWPAVAVVYEEVGGWRFPDTLIVWETASSRNVPRVSECVIFCPDPSAANRLVEIRLPNDHRSLPLPNEMAELQSLLSSIKAAVTDDDKVELTDRLFIARPAPGSPQRGAIRFEEEARPSRHEWSEYMSHSMDRDELSWPLGWGGEQTGLRGVWIRTELQIVAGSDRANDAARWSMPFFGSATNMHTLGSSSMVQP